MDSQSKHIAFDTPVQYLKGVGPARAEVFLQLGVETVEDLLEYYPRNWVFMPEPIPISQARPKQTATIAGVIEQTDFLKFRRPPMFTALVSDDDGFCRIVWFHGSYLQNQLEPGQLIMASGKFSTYKHQLQLTNPKFTILESEDQLDPECFNGPVYPATAKLSTRQIRRIIHTILDECTASVSEWYSPAFCKKNELISRADSLQHIHKPKDEEVLEQAKRRLKFDELFFMQLGLAMKRYHTQHYAPAPFISSSETIDSRIRKRFPFLLTEDQDSVIQEIASDMAKPVAMNRLLQGDVGSGKTVVAVYAALLAIANKTQAAIMVPTEILADQHYHNINRFLKGSSVKTALLTGSLKQKQKDKLIRSIAEGRIDLVVGTHALIQEDVEFANPGLVIIDEQHKFGVHQRGKLRRRHNPHCLVMTATPIPRTLAMTAFGDLDVSVIKHLPPGRGEVVTRWVRSQDRQKAYDFIRQRLKAKKQAYFVYPRIDNTEESDDIKAAIQEHAILSETVYPEFKVGLLHGKMSSDAKEAAMKAFRQGDTDVLVSTVVIEVGMDVPNATMMVIEHADRFGLAQLHQLRGRIGRGQSKSYCFLFADTENDIAVSRLEVMTRTTDGFRIAEHDLKLRGPGELFSTRQHGLPDLKIADIIEDFDLLNLARHDAFKVIQDDPLLSSPEHTLLREMLLKKFGSKLGLVDIA